MIAPHYRSVRDRLAQHPRRWLVTGVAGFIGSNILEDLLGLGQTVIGLDNFSTGYQTNIDEALAAHPDDAHRFTLVEGDIRDLAACRTACADVDFVLHHAALASVPRSIEEPLVNNAVNVGGFVNMLTAAKDAGVSRFVYASSSAVYGDAAEQPQREEITGRPLSPYAASKAINETYAAAFQMTYGIETVGLRYYNIFGRRQDPDGAYAAVIPRWISNLLRDQPCAIFGDGATTRDFCHVANVIQANLLAATEDNVDATANAYNVACSHSITLSALFELIREELSTLAPRVARAVPAYMPFRPGDIRFSSATIEKAQRMLAFSPTFSVRDGLREALAWYVDQSRGSYPYEAVLVE